MKSVPGYEDQGVYVDEEGQIWRRLSIHKDAHGYPMVKVMGRGVRVHSLVCRAYHGSPKDGQEVRHLDGSVDNNDPKNLSWGSHTDNMQDAVLHGTHYDGAKITADDRQEIIARRSLGESLRSIADDFGISPQRVCDLSKGRYKK